MSPTVIVVGPLPPPVHGASRVTRQVVAVAQAAAEESSRVVSVSTGGPGLVRSPRYHLVRVLAHLRAAATVLRHRLSGPVTLYLAGAGGLGLCYQAVLVLVARATGCRTVFHHHSYHYLGEVTSPWMRRICRWQRPGDAQILLTEHMRSRFAARYSTAADVVCVSNTFAVRAGAAPEPRRGGGFSLIHVSNLSTEKGTGLVLDAFEQLRERRPGYALVLVGEATEPGLRQRIRTLERAHPGAFRCLGQQDESGVVAALDAAHLLVFPSLSRDEAEPMVVLESLARGVPALVSRRGSMVTMVPPGWQLTPGAALADEIERVLADDWPQLSALARRTFEDMGCGVELLVQQLHR